MAIPMEPITVKMPPADIPSLDKQAQARGFEGRSDYVRHLVAQDKEVLHKQWLALNPIFGVSGTDINKSVVGLGSTEDSQ